MATKWFSSVGFIFVFLVTIDVTTVSAVSCSTCLHVKASLLNVPKSQANQLITRLSSLSNPACVEGNTQFTKCPSSIFKRTKCMKTVTRFRTVGMVDLYPEAVLEQFIVTRACALPPLSEADTCTSYNSFDQLDLETRSALRAKIEQARRKWESITFSVKICYKAAGSFYNPVTEGPIARPPYNHVTEGPVTHNPVTEVPKARPPKNQGIKDSDNGAGYQLKLSNILTVLLTIMIKIV